MTIKTLFLSTTLAALILVAGASATLANEHGQDHAATETAPAAPAEDAKKADDHSDHDKEHKDEDTKKKY